MKNYFLLFFSIFSLLSSAQTLQQDFQASPSIRVKSFVKKDQVLLRWAVDEPLAWKKANKKGFRLKRYTVARDGKLLETADVKDLGVFVPPALESWKDRVETNDQAAIMAQAIYGESFSTELGRGQGTIESIVNQSQESEQRFAFALMAADLDFELACFAGYGFRDKQINVNERYLYVVESNTENKDFSLENGQVLVDFSRLDELPKPIGFMGFFEDKKAILSWEYLLLKDFYTSYFIEKSQDGIVYDALGDLPVINMNEKQKNPSRGIIYIDSLAQNNTKYFYRIRGKNLFGEFGPYSSVVSGIGIKALEAAPVIDAFDIKEDNRVSITWNFPQEAEQEIASFEILHSEDDRETSYKTVEKNIPSDRRSFLTKSRSASNYFKLRAVGKNGDHKESFSVLVQEEDNTPPMAPIGLKGKIDSSGVVMLEWNPNTEADLEGYHIFRAHQKNEEPIRITPSSVKEAFYKDSVQVNSLNDKVYYYVSATDKRKNQSEFSTVITLEKPSKIKPPAPVFSDYGSRDGGIFLVWIKSSATDLLAHRLYRKEEQEASWQMIYETKEIQAEYSYTDKSVSLGKKYHYYLEAINKKGLKSDRMGEISFRAESTNPQKLIRSLIASAGKNGISLQWRIAGEAEEIMVYRQRGEENPSKLRVIGGKQNFFEDTRVEAGNRYTYFLKAMTRDNKPSETEKISLEY